MPTIYDAKRWVYDLLVTAKNEGKINIDGQVYKDAKPSYGKEDIVVNSILMDNEFFQNAVLNVNCYVPDLEISSSSRVVRMPNFDRLEVIAADVAGVLKDNVDSQVYRSYIDRMEQIKEVEEDSHFVNFRLQLYAVNY